MRNSFLLFLLSLTAVAASAASPRFYQKVESQHARIAILQQLTNGPRVAFKAACSSKIRTLSGDRFDGFAGVRRQQIPSLSEPRLSRKSQRGPWNLMPWLLPDGSATTRQAISATHTFE